MSRKERGAFDKRGWE